VSYLDEEIAQQPSVIAHLLNEEDANIRRIAAAIRDFNPAFIAIAARGTSDNAARYAQYTFGIHARMPVALSTPSVHTLYEVPVNLSKAVVIGVSQSGQSVDVMRVVEDARAQGALTIGITNDPDSPIAHAAAHHIWIRAGDELSIAATKTYTAQLTVMAMLTAALADDAGMHEALKALPLYAQQTLDLSEPIRRWAERYRYMTYFASIGRGYNYATAIEISLKVKELCYVIGHGYSEADFLHGPIAIIQSGFPVIVTAPSGKTFDQMVDLLAKLRERDAEALVISDDDRAFVNARQQMRLPAGVPEWLTPITAILPGQMFAMSLAIAKGHEIDRPRGLTKVTMTL
jgi:glucosamine--fructose-6-phosphate aminotransferase (isomerizing)